MDGATILDQIIFLYLSIVIQLYLQTKLLYPYKNREAIKRLLLEFLINFNFQDLMIQNACLVLLLINKIFISSDQMDRDNLIKLIPIQKLVLTLEHTNIDIDYRTQILIFLKSSGKSALILFIKGSPNFKKGLSTLFAFCSISLSF